MSLIFIDGFNHYNTSDISKKWNAINTSPTITVGAGRNGSQGLVINSSNEYVQKSVTPGASWVFGFAFKITALPASNGGILVLYDVSTAQLALTLNSDGTFTIKRGGQSGTALTGGTSTLSISVGAFYYIELKCTISNSIAASSCRLMVDGVEWINVATGQDTQNTANASISNYRLGSEGTITGTATYADHYVCDQAGAVNNNFLGDCRVDTLYPTSDGTYTDFTPSTGVSHFDLVDETAPNTTDYNTGSAGSPGDRDSYGLSDLPALASSIVYGVQVNAAVLKTDAGMISIAPFVRSSTTNGDGASASLTTSQLYVSRIFELNPATSTAWTEATVNAMQAGLAVV